MPDQPYLNRTNDTHLLTPLLVMALIIVAGILFCTYTGYSLA